MQHCCKTSWKAMLHVFLSWNRTCLATNQVVETFCCKTGLNAGDKTRNIAYNSFCRDVARQVSCTFLLPVSPYTCSFCRWRILVINKPWRGSKSPKIPLRVCSSLRLVTPIQTYSARVLNLNFLKWVFRHFPFVFLALSLQYASKLVFMRTLTFLPLVIGEIFLSAIAPFSFTFIRIHVNTKVIK